MSRSRRPKASGWYHPQHSFIPAYRPPYRNESFHKRGNSLRNLPGSSGETRQEPVRYSSLSDHRIHREIAEFEASQ